MFYYLYEMRNTINNKIYIGVHKTKNINDGYTGSGKVIRNAIEKYGIENFTKTILEFFNDPEAMFAREKEVVNEEFLARSDVYNLRRGGLGGFDHINKNLTTSERSKYGRLGGIKATSIISEEEHRNRTKNAITAVKQRKIGFYDPEIRKLGNSPEARKKAVASQREYYKIHGHQQGEKNSQFGSMWITNGSENKKIKKELTIPEGWQKGRIRNVR